jgi:hypothetical protein
MKLGKIFILTMIFWILIISSTSSIIAADEEEIFTDPQGDVLTLDLSDLDGNLSITNEKPNIDIIKLTYIHEDGSSEATIILEVYGMIEDKGNLDDVDSFNSIVLYALQLETSRSVYDFSYVNKQCQVNLQNTSNWTVNGGILTIDFTLDSPDETYKNIYSNTMDTELDSLSSGGWSFDTYPDESLIEAYAEGPNEANVGEIIEFSGDAINIIGTTDAFTYQWDFGDGKTSTKQYPTHSYTTAGTYIATLTVTDDQGNTANDTITLTISDIENGGNNNGGGTDQNGSDSGLFLFFSVIAIIVIIGIIALVIIIRR